MYLVNSWALSLVVSIIYLGLFLHISRSDNDIGNDLLFGFCLSGVSSTPTKVYGCHKDFRNSHMASYILDSIMGYAVYYLYRRIQKKTKGRLNPVVTIHFQSMAAVILVHGFLHLIMSEIVNCYIDPTSLPTWIKAIGLVIFAVFCFLLCMVILGMSFARDGRGWTGVAVTSFALTATTLALTVDTGLEWILPCIFSISHPLACIAALFSKSPMFTQTMGWTFLLASSMGILELTQCSTLYRRLGGHVLYDFWLHVTVLLCLPPFAPPISSLTVKKGT
mmetsp:Transcript_5238/g.10666  ORF Transcript_5238/g.10666 Transcript_5238/m.10666 type:complete len:278 (-) Transcript_5238:1607-2440(-)